MQHAARMRAGAIASLSLALSLAATGLDALPPEIGQLANLQYLHLSGNPISELPSEI